MADEMKRPIYNASGSGTINPWFAGPIADGLRPVLHPDNAVWRARVNHFPGHVCRFPSAMHGAENDVDAGAGSLFLAGLFRSSNSPSADDDVLACASNVARALERWGTNTDFSMRRNILTVFMPRPSNLATAHLIRSRRNRDACNHL